jgi:hypothetical protein
MEYINILIRGIALGIGVAGTMISLSEDNPYIAIVTVGVSVVGVILTRDGGKQ